jgi:hypothetical protein
MHEKVKPQIIFFTILLFWLCASQEQEENTAGLPITHRLKSFALQNMKTEGQTLPLYPKPPLLF